MGIFCLRYKIVLERREIFNLPVWLRHSEQILFWAVLWWKQKSHVQQTLDIRSDMEHRTGEHYMQTVLCVAYATTK